MKILNCICYPNPHSPLGSVCYQFFKSNTRLHSHERSNPIATLGGQSTNERQVAIKQSDGTTTFWYNSVGKKILAQIGVTLLIVLIFVSFLFCCIIPYIRKLTSSLITSSEGLQLKLIHAARV
ncbi:hypothetical protein XELAEV_18008579mg [Xenopus laevis]|uniref:Uncharacterized protein n=1 Tax=Xenopus laevis TaxID=8355 RepID=A0A974E364_XENLA|nr:hypothetical protein XELAEV_18008579mg [Xenopus laevis]